MQLFDVGGREEFDLVRNCFFKSLDKCAGRSLRLPALYPIMLLLTYFLLAVNLADGTIEIVKIQRIQSQALWKEYVEERRKVADKNGGNPNEKELWHGTR